MSANLNAALSNQAQHSADDLVVYRIADLSRMGYGSRATIWRKTRSGDFPPPHDISGRPGWFGSQLREWWSA